MDRAATSGGYRRGFDIGGQHYSHIVDPRTGKTAEAILLTPAESRKVAAQLSGAEYMLIAANGRKIFSPGFAAGDEVTVTFELANLGGYGRRPYVAVWLEDKDKFPIKTLAVWYQKPRWLPELKSWYRDDRMRSMAEGSDIAGPASTPSSGTARTTPGSS